MATTHGAVPPKGCTIGNLTYYWQKGKSFVRRKTSLNKKKMKEPQFWRFRMSTSAFVIASAVAKDLYRKLAKGLDREIYYEMLRQAKILAEHDMPQKMIYEEVKEVWEELLPTQWMIDLDKVTAKKKRGRKRGVTVSPVVNSDSKPDTEIIQATKLIELQIESEGAKYFVTPFGLVLSDETTDKQIDHIIPAEEIVGDNDDCELHEIVLIDDLIAALESNHEMALEDDYIPQVNVMSFANDFPVMQRSPAMVPGDLNRTCFSLHDRDNYLREIIHAGDISPAPDFIRTPEIDLRIGSNSNTINSIKRKRNKSGSRANAAEIQTPEYCVIQDDG